MNRFETISTGDLRLGAKAETLLWSASFLVITAMMTSALYAAVVMGPPAEEAAGGSPAIMIDFAPLPVAPDAGEEQVATTGSEIVHASDDEAASGSDDPVAFSEPEPEPEELAPEDGILASEDPDPAEPDESVTEQEPIEKNLPPDEDIVPEPVDPLRDPSEIDTPEVEAELTLPRLAAIPDDIARLRAQTPATSHSPPPQQQAAAPRAAAPAQATANQTSSQPAAPAAPPAPQSPLAPQISPQRWQSQLFAHLDRFKRYPSAASQRREQGTVYVQFSIDAAGNILSSRIVRSSGHPNLDAAVSQMMRTASPVPPPPAGLGNPVTLTAPIEFSLR